MADGDGSQSREEFEQFIRDNREMIMRILEEDRRSTRAAADEIRETYVEPVKDHLKETANSVLRVLADETVQKHFITACMEAVYCFEAAIRAMPLSDEAREVVDNLEKTKDNTIRNVAVTGTKNEVKSKMEKINISNIKEKITDVFTGDKSEERDE